MYYIHFRFQDIANKSKDELINLGFPQFTIEDFHETVSHFSFYDYQFVFIKHTLYKCIK